MFLNKFEALMLYFETVVVDDDDTMLASFKIIRISRESLCWVNKNVLCFKKSCKKLFSNHEGKFDKSPTYSGIDQNFCFHPNLAKLDSASCLNVPEMEGTSNIHFHQSREVGFCPLLEGARSGRSFLSRSPIVLTFPKHIWRSRYRTVMSRSCVHLRSTGLVKQ